MTPLDNLLNFDGSDQKSSVKVPRAYTQRNAWEPKIGDIAPDFTATTTQGDLRFYDWAEGNWTVLFNQARVGGGVSTTEMAVLAGAHFDFAARGVNLLGLVQGTPHDITPWLDDTSHRFGVNFDFPVICDTDLSIASAYGMTNWTEGIERAVRKTLLINPALRVCCVTEYPMNMGRSVEELLRIVDAQQAHERTGLVTPADWHVGDPAIVPIYLPEEEQQARYGGAMTQLYPGMRIVQTGPRTTE